MELQGRGHIYFLSFSDSIPSWYVNLAKNFHEHSMDLIPIRADQLEAVLNEEIRVHLICFDTSFNERNSFGNKVLRLLNQAFKTKKLTLYHFSSFSHFEKFSHLRRENLYNFFHLPLKTADAVMAIAKIRQKDSSGKQSWPGGKRAGMLD